MTLEERIIKKEKLFECHIKCAEKVTVKHVSDNQLEMFSSYLHNLRFNSTLKKTFVMTAAQSF